MYRRPKTIQLRQSLRRKVELHVQEQAQWCEQHPEHTWHPRGTMIPVWKDVQVLDPLTGQRHTRYKMFWELAPHRDRERQSQGYLMPNEGKCSRSRWSRFSADWKCRWWDPHYARWRKRRILDALCTVDDFEEWECLEDEDEQHTEYEVTLEAPGN